MPHKLLITRTVLLDYRGTSLLKREAPLYFGGRRGIHIPWRSGYRGASLIRTPPPLRPYCRTIPRVIWWY